MKRLLRKVAAQCPTRLPQGMAEFERWSDDILDLYGMPNNDSTKFALAVSIQHLDSTVSAKPKAFFGRLLQKGAANQIAYAVMQDLKQKQQAAAEAEKLAAQQKAEAPGVTESQAPDGQAAQKS